MWMVRKSAWGKLTAQATGQVVGSTVTTTLPVGQVGIINGVNVGVRANPQINQVEVPPSINFHAVDASGVTLAIANVPFYTVTRPNVSDIPATRRASSERMAQMGYEP